MVRVFSLIFLAALLLHASPVLAQDRTSVAGTVLDDDGGAIAGARVSLANEQGVVTHQVTTDGAGAFVLRNVSRGRMTLVVEKPLFAPASESVIVPAAGTIAPLRLTLKTAGVAEEVVVTAERTESRIAETPQKIEVVSAIDIERSVAADLTDVLKKNSGVDVIQYTGALSGIGIRGFRPQFSGVNQRSLLLIDGRPSGVTNPATLLLDDVDRIEVLKGAASAVYGSSAMGGVVNVLTRESRGKIGGQVRVGAGSFGRTELSGRTGGSVSSNVDVDFNGNAVDQRDDIRLGNGVIRPATSFKTYSGSGRVGVDLPNGWRVEGRSDFYRGRDINIPPDLAFGTVGQSRKNVERTSLDGGLFGHIGQHALTMSLYRATEDNHTSNVTSFDPTDLPYLPYLSFESGLAWTGVQVKDLWLWHASNTLVMGFDFDHVSSDSHSYSRSGQPVAPFFANYVKRTDGFYAENTARLRRGRTIVTVGGRLDRIGSGTLETPLMTNFKPSSASFLAFNPSAGIKHELFAGLRVHGTAGRAFIPPEASMLTGYTTTVVRGRTQISQGNSDLKPERSISVDAGLEWTTPQTRIDVTGFRTRVRDRFISNVVVSNPPAPDPIVLSVANGLYAHISGLELEGERRLSRSIGIFANVTHYFTRKEQLASGAEQDILNVARNTVRAGVDLDVRRVTARAAGRYVQGRRDNDFNAPGFPIVDYDNFTVVDASVAYRVASRQSIVLMLNNVFDTYYYEKLGYPLAGASFTLSYRAGF